MKQLQPAIFLEEVNLRKLCHIDPITFSFELDSPKLYIPGSLHQRRRYSGQVLLIKTELI